MALNNLTAGAIATSVKHLRAARGEEGIGSVIEFGNQRLLITAGIINYIKSLIGVELNLPTERKQFINSTPSFFKQLGFDSYLAIDMNEKAGAIALDLNKSILDDYNYNSRHDLVVDNGTGEHVFNQHMIFKNQHDLCKKGGFILNCKPFFPWINHGFYSLQPVIFRDLAYANDYKQVFIWLGGNHGEFIDMTGDDRLWVEQPRTMPFWERPKSYLEECIFDKLLDKNNITIVTCYQKTTSQPFKMPIQGKWVHNISDPTLLNEYGSQPDTFDLFHS